MDLIPLSNPVGRPIIEELRDRGFVRLDASKTFKLLGPEVEDTWDDFVTTWDDLGEDLYMADGGRYRRRRYAAFLLENESYVRKPHQPHYQSRDYNPLNGDVQRWFDPLLPATVEQPAARAIFDLCASLISEADDNRSGKPRHVEVHQFRIETTVDHIGRPTPEGLHRDGVDWAFVLLIRRENVREGITQVGSPGGASLGSFLLERPGDAVILDDRRVLHGVTEIKAVDPSLPAYRDALVITFSREP